MTFLVIQDFYLGSIWMHRYQERGFGDMRQEQFSRHAARIRIWQHAIGFCTFVVLSLIGVPSDADIATDGTVGPARNLAGPDFRIGAELGTTRGANLFHSFRIFNIHTGESATFTGPDNIANVISRVTGGEVSTIDGLLRSEVGQANFYFINPAGVMFGPNAKVDVPAAFHIGTADELRFEDGAVFSAIDPTSSSFSIAPPASFGFLSPQPASITVNGSQLTFAPNSRASMAAGNVTIQDGATLVSSGGDIQITAVGDAGDVVHLASGAAESAGNGTIAITESTIDVSGTQGSETVALRGGLVEIADSVIAADHWGSEDSAGRILLEADRIRVINSDIHARVFGAGRGNDIVVIAEDLEVDAATAEDGRSRLTTRVMPEASGAAGDVRVEAARVMLTNGGQLQSVVLGGALGPGGTVEVQATDSITIEGSNESGVFSGIATTTLSEANAAGGTIVINSPTASLRIAEGGFLQSGSDGAGKAGDIFLTASELRLVNGSEVLASTSGSGAAGNISIEVGGLVSLDNSFIEAATEDTGPAGQIVLRADDLNLLSGSAIIASTLGTGAGGSLAIDVENSFLIDNLSFISSGSLGKGSGTAGDIRVTAENLEIINGGLIENSTIGDGDAGTIVVEATDLVINGGGTLTGILSDAFLGSGKGGDIQVTVIGRLELVNGGQIGSNTHDEGAAGTVSVEAAELVINGGGENQSAFTGIFSDARVSSGSGGDVQVIATERLEISSGGAISSITLVGQGDAGTITVESAEIVIDGEGQRGTTGILATTNGSSGNAGGVQVTATERLEILNGGQISSSSENGGDAGMVTVNAAELMIDGQGAESSSTGIFSQTTGSLSGSISGIGGDVQVMVAQRLELRNGGQISTSSGIRGRDAGTVTVRATEIAIDGQDSGILSETVDLSSGVSGIAGDVTVTATQRLELRNAGQISTSSGFGGGNAGSVTVEAGELVINGQNAGVFSEASAGSLGQVGSVRITAQDLRMTEQGEISIAANQTLPENRLGSGPGGLIHINAGEIHLNRGARITAESTGNIPASAIEIHAGNLLMEGESRITTESNEADGGPISINGDNIIMRDSLITTSVRGLTGDGGNINVNADALVLQGGFIQANTAAPVSRGGDIFIDTEVLIASRGLLEVGGTERLEFQPGSERNVIQAAAPGGEQGTITITSPELDISGTLVMLSTPFADAPRLISDPCTVVAGQAAISLIQHGKGGIAAGPEEPAAVSFGGERLDRLLDTEAEKPVTNPPPRRRERSNSIPTGCQKGG
jgi:filamentous hemagglutinin family protein